MVVHNETSTGVTSRIHEIRKAIDRAKHPGVAARRYDLRRSARSDYEHDAWGVDVTVSVFPRKALCCRRVGFNAVSDKALQAAKANRQPLPTGLARILSRTRMAWPYTAGDNLLYGLKEAISHADGGGARQRCSPAI